MSQSVVFMGVAGAGKSTLAEAVAKRVRGVLIEGDDFHPEASRQKMASGQPLTDEDRRGWLDALIHEAARHPGGAVLTCSALKRRYRDTLRAALPGIRFVYLDIDEELTRSRVASRPAHLFPATLVASQFEALEPPENEPDVLRLDAAQPLPVLVEQAVEWVSQGGKP
jgi:gluconokinase